MHDDLFIIWIINYIKALIPEKIPFLDRVCRVSPDIFQSLSKRLAAINPLEVARSINALGKGSLTKSPARVNPL